MRVNIAQLVPNCVVIQDVIGKSGRPLIKKNTVLTEQHLLLLDKFLIEEVEVSHKLADGTTFKPKEVEKKEIKENKVQPTVEQEFNVYNLSFKDHYVLVVRGFKEEFKKWERLQNIDMFKVRGIIIPLLERVEEVGLNIFFLHHHANKDDYIYHHSVSVCLLSFYLAKRLGLSKKEAIQVGLAGLLSDAGLARINIHLRQKYIPLIQIENEELKRHPAVSYRLIESEITVSQELKLAVLQHHERLDGSGFPLGVESEKIHFFSRIVSVCDFYHALLCDLQFKNRPSFYLVIKTLLDRQFTKFDPKIVQELVDTIASLLIGAYVKLSNQQVAKVIFINQKNLLFPIVQLVDDEQMISLEQNRELTFIDVLMDW